VMLRCWPATRCCFALRPHSWKSCNGRVQKDVVTSFVPMPTSVCCAWTKLDIYPLTTRPQTYFTKSSIAVTNASRSFLLLIDLLNNGARSFLTLPALPLCWIVCCTTPMLPSSREKVIASAKVNRKQPLGGGKNESSHPRSGDRQLRQHCPHSVRRAS